MIKLDSIYYTNGAKGDIVINLRKDAPLDIGDSSGSLVFPFYNGSFIMSYHLKRRGWEFPAGKREEGETPIECGVRETFEETGAILKNIVTLGYYTVDNTNKYAIFMAEVERFEPKPRLSETDLVKLFDEIPKDLTYDDDVYNIVLEFIKSKYNNKN